MQPSDPLPVYLGQSTLLKAVLFCILVLALLLLLAFAPATPH